MAAEQSEDAVAPTAAKIENLRAGCGTEQPHCPAAAALVQAGGHHSVGEIVTRSDSRKHLANEKGLLAFRVASSRCGVHDRLGCFQMALRSPPRLLDPSRPRY